MKKILIALILSCFVLAFVAVTPKPVFADDASVGLILGLSAAVGVVVALIVVNSSNKNDDSQQRLIMKQRSERDTKFDSRVGKWTYDEMLAEMGAPSSVTEGDKIKVATYDSTKTTTVGSTVYHKGNFLSEESSDYKANEEKSGEIYTFTFDKKQNTLKDWHYKRIDNNKKNNLSEESGYSGAVTTEKVKAEPAGESETSALKQKLRDLKNLLDGGDITKEEYKKMREKLLNEVK
jgi:hypothetical protein